MNSACGVRGAAQCCRTARFSKPRQRLHQIGTGLQRGSCRNIAHGTQRYCPGSSLGFARFFSADIQINEWLQSSSLPMFVPSAPCPNPPKSRLQVARGLAPLVFYSWIINRDYDATEFLEGCSHARVTVADCLGEGKLEKLRPLMSPHVFEAHERTCELYQTAGVESFRYAVEVEELKILRTSLKLAAIPALGRHGHMRGLLPLTWTGTITVDVMFSLTERLEIRRKGGELLSPEMALPAKGVVRGWRFGKTFGLDADDPNAGRWKVVDILG